MTDHAGTEWQLAGPNGVLRGSVFVPDEKHWPAPSVVFCHGFKGFKDWGPWPWLTARLSERGFIVHRFNFSHAGVGPAGVRHDEPEKFAVNTYGKELEDLGFLLPRLSQTQVPQEATSDRVGLVGHSRGGMVSILFASEEPAVDAVVSLASPGFSDRFSDEVKEEWRAKGALDIVNQRTGEVLPLDVSVLDDYEANVDRYDVAAAIQRRVVPTLVIHGDGDESVPVQEARILKGSLAPETSDVYLIDGAGHTFDAAHPFDETNVPVAIEQLLDQTAQWLERHLR